MKKYALYFAWVVALVAAGGSVYLSALYHLKPCALCWMQRACLFPLVLLLGIATYRQDKGVKIYALPLAVAGGLVALYQLLDQLLGQKFSLLKKVCDGSCADGYLLPALSLLAFLLITLLLVCSNGKEEKGATRTER